MKSLRCCDFSDVSKKESFDGNEYEQHMARISDSIMSEK